MTRGTTRWLVVVLAVAFAATLAATGDRTPSAFHAPRVASQHLVQFASGYEIPESIVSPGDFTCAGGDPTGSFPPCTPETRHIALRGRTTLFVYTELDGAAAAMLDGTNTVVSNCNLNASYQGRCWGSFRWEVEGLGAWEGTWSGPFDLVANQGFYTVIAHGVDGELEGLHLSGTGAYPGGSAPGIIVGRVSDAD